MNEKVGVPFKDAEELKEWMKLGDEVGDRAFQDWVNWRWGQAGSEDEARWLGWVSVLWAEYRKVRKERDEAERAVKDAVNLQVVGEVSEWVQHSWFGKRHDEVVRRVMGC